MAHPFRFGVVTAYGQSRSAWTSKARRIEELGYSTLLMPDRATIGSLSVFPAMAVAAEATTRLRVGSYVLCNGYRHPVMVAREAATLDVLSEGRLELGLGAGVSAQDFEQMGLPVESPGQRVSHLEETLQLVKQLLTQETVNFTGTHYTVTHLRGNLKPQQKPHFPILVAGGGERMLKLAAREASIIAIGGKIGPTEPTLDQKVAWIKEASGERFAELELSQTIFGIELTDGPVPPAPQVGGPPAPKHPMSTEQAIERLLEERERYGFSYLQVYEGQMENFAPVVARLTGK